MSPITNLSEQPQEYAAAITEADTLEKLVEAVRGYRELAFDAYIIAKGMTEDDFVLWRVGLEKERKGEFAGERFSRSFGMLMMPEILMKVALVAQRFSVPWGCAYLRLKETGNLRRVLA